MIIIRKRVDLSRFLALFEVAGECCRLLPGGSKQTRATDSGRASSYKQSTVDAGISSSVSSQVRTYDRSGCLASSHTAPALTLPRSAGYGGQGLCSRRYTHDCQRCLLIRPTRIDQILAGSSAGV